MPRPERLRPRVVAAAAACLSCLAVKGAEASQPGQPATLEEAWTREGDLLAHVSGPGAVGVEDSLPLMRMCVAKSWWSAAKALVARTHQHDGANHAGQTELPALRDEVSRLLSGIKASADEFAAFADETYRDQTAGLDEVHCALQWAQNSTSVFLGVKYATRWSAPGAISIVDLKVNASDCCFGLEAFGHHSSIRKRYLVEAGLYGDIVPSLSSWSSASVGRLTATLQKAKPGIIWPRLMKAKGKTSTKHQITSWLDMEERWSEELKKNAAKDRKKGEEEKASTTQAPSPKADKGKRVPATWRKDLTRKWKRLRRALKDGHNLAAALLATAVVVCMATCFCRMWRESRPHLKANDEHYA